MNNNKGSIQLVIIGVVVLAIAAGAFFLNSSTKDSTKTANKEDVMVEDKMEEDRVMEEEMVHGIVISVDGEDYYFDGPADGKGGEKDIPGHNWSITGENTLSGKHYNTGPNGSAKFWSSDAEDGVLLYEVDAIIDEWTTEKANSYADDGFVHYHELVSVGDVTFHPTKVVWLKHTAVTSFTLDGDVVGNFAHEVEPGLDLEFPPNGKTPYNPN